MTDISSLPQEILLAIFEHIQSPWPFNHWLTPSTAVCRAWRPLALSIAYRDIVALNEDDVRKASQHAKYIRSLSLGGRRRWHKRYAAVCPACAELRGIFNALAAVEEAAPPELEIDLQLYIHATIISYVYTDDEPDPFAPRTADVLDDEGELGGGHGLAPEASEHEDGLEHENELENEDKSAYEGPSELREGCGSPGEDVESDDDRHQEDEAASGDEAIHSGDDSNANLDYEEEGADLDEELVPTQDADGGFEEELDSQHWRDVEDYQDQETQADDGPRSDCPFFDNSLEAALFELPKLNRVATFSVTLAGSLASHSIWSGWLLASRTPAVTIFNLFVDQRTMSELSIPRSFDEYLHLLPASVRELEINYEDAPPRMERERSDVAYSLLKRRGLTRLVFEGGINHFALGPDDDEGDHELAASTIQHLTIHVDVDGQRWLRCPALTPGQQNGVDMMLPKAARLLASLPRAENVTFYAPGIECEYMPGILFLSPIENYSPSQHVLDAFSYEMKRRNGKDGDMAVRIKSGDETIWDYAGMKSAE